MVLQEYELVLDPQYRGLDARIEMRCCQIIVKNIKSLGREEKDKEEITRVRRDYQGYRDVAIKYGMDVSEFPRRLK